MDMQKLVDAMNAAGRSTRSDYHLTLGELIAALRDMPEDLRVDCGDVDGEHPGRATSYRGYYSDLAFMPTKDATTAGELLKICEATLGTTLEGYKGGDFLMDANTPLWISEYGSSSGRAVIGITVDGPAKLIIKTIS
jgi:hypothetical protein